MIPFETVFGCKIILRNGEKRETDEMNSSESSLADICKDQQIFDRLQAYLVSCTPDNTACDKKSSSSQKASFPNVAGFCRFLGVGTEDLEAIGDEYPSVHAKILAVFEDEALNSGLSATLLSAYLKRHLGYDSSARHSKGASQLQIRFEHDIMEDGE